MRRSWLLWLLFSICLAVAFSAMGWISLTTLRLDRAEIDARRQAQLEENVRLALWRMDSMLAPLIAQETARPYFAYSAFTPAERAYTRMFAEIKYGDVLVPSPLLTFNSPQILLHFQFQPDGTLASPQVPTGNMRDLATRHTTRDRLIECSHRLDQFQSLISRQKLLAVLPTETIEHAFPATQPAPGLANTAGSVSNAARSVPPRQSTLTNQAAQAPMEQADPAAPPAQRQQLQKSVNEFQMRAANAAQAANRDLESNYGYVRSESPAPHVREGLMCPLWIDDTLLLGRRVTINDQQYVQGCWLNWPAIRDSLLDSIRDLLPSAQLQPAAADAEDRQPRRLAAIPAKLIPGPIASDVLEPTSPVRITLLIAWICTIAGSAAVAMLLWGAIALSHRRAAFVSAVTHELRTPLTTVSMYAEMLEEGMVADETKRRRYLSTLRGEADRLGHLVENVLAYSRLERGNPSARIQTVGLSELIEGVKGRLTTRAEQAGMDLRVETAPDAANVSARADAAAVEQILFNLVDNAGKYGRNESNRRLHLQVRREGRFAVIALQDHGPGISPADAKRLFRPFSKSARDAANSAPGVGLGLALSRRLARAMHGDLVLCDSLGPGACFVLKLQAV